MDITTITKISLHIAEILKPFAWMLAVIALLYLQHIQQRRIRNLEQKVQALLPESNPKSCQSQNSNPSDHK